jgi:hypothetical protein
MQATTVHDPKPTFGDRLLLHKLIVEASISC